MAHEKLTKLLCETIRVSETEAAAALEARDWNVMKAAELLQRDQKKKRIRAAQKVPDRGWFAKLFGVEGGPVTFHSPKLTIRRFSIARSAAP